jgi:replicative DNA helicase
MNSLLDTQDIITVVENGGDNVFDEYKDVWIWVHDFYYKYEKVPSKAIVKDKFSSFEFLDTSSAPLQYYIDDAKKQSLARSVRGDIAKSIEILKENGPYAAINFLTTAGHKILKEVGGLKDSNLVDEYGERVDAYRERYENPNSRISGVPSGINVIDKIWGGFQDGDFVCLMGIPGCGKTWLSRLFALNAWQGGFSPLIISLEMSKEQEGYRLDTILNQGELFTSSDLLSGTRLTPKQYQKWAEDHFTDKPPIYLVTAEGMETASQNMVQAKIDQYKPDIVIVDYVNIMEDSDGGGTETDRIRNIFKSMKRMAVKNGLPIIAISAVTMKGDDYGTRAPQLGELAWSKHAAHDCDLVLAIHREPDAQVFEVVARKTRRSEPFAFYLDWDLNSGKWKEQFTDGWASNDGGT